MQILKWKLVSSIDFLRLLPRKWIFKAFLQLKSILVTKITSIQVLQHQATRTRHDITASRLIQDVVIVNKREEER